MQVMCLPWANRLFSFGVSCEIHSSRFNFRSFAPRLPLLAHLILVEMMRTTLIAALAAAAAGFNAPASKAALAPVRPAVSSPRFAPAKMVLT